MAIDLELQLRGPDAYALARQAVAQMEKQEVWPTPLNFEIFTHYVAAPEGPNWRTRSTA